jgi:hypothetical protein
MRITALSLVLLSATALSAQTLPAYRHRLLGVFDSEGRPLSGVEVTDLKSGTTALTTSTGTVTLAYLPDGGSDVRVRQVGYIPVTQFVRIGPADTVPVTVILISSTTVLPTVIARDSARHVSPGLVDFEERRHLGRGYFIAEKELRKSDNREMANVIRTIPGVVVSCAKTFPFDCHAVSGRAQSKYAILGGGPCEFMLYVDGSRVSVSDLNSLRVADYAGIESYSGSQVPMQYNATGAACGVILFWTKER